MQPVIRSHTPTAARSAESLSATPPLAPLHAAAPAPYTARTSAATVAAYPSSGLILSAPWGRNSDGGSASSPLRDSSGRPRYQGDIRVPVYFASDPRKVLSSSL